MNFDTIILVAGVICGIIGGGVVHEFGHAWAAFRLGDDYAASEGRLTLNPAAHIDPFLSVILPLILFLTTKIAFGGMKPVPFNPAKFRHPDRDIMLTAAAGPGFQMIFVVVVWAAFLLLSPFIAMGSFAFWLFYYTILANVLIALFNLLIPVPPLDCSKIVRYFLPATIREQYDSIGGFLGLGIVFLLVFSGAVRTVLVPFLKVTNSLFVWTYENLALVHFTGLMWETAGA